MRAAFFFFLVTYLFLVLFFGVKASRRMKSLEDFFLASRRLSSRLVFLSLTASWFGATSILVTTDEAFKAGLRAIWLVGVPAVLTVLIFAFFLAPSIRRLPILTLPDLVEQFYGRLVRHMTSLLLLWYLVVLASSQMVAIGQFLKPFLGLSYFWSLALGTGFVLVYLVSGGLRSVAATDTVQFFFLAAGVAGLTFFLFRSLGLMSFASLPGRLPSPAYLNFFCDSGRNFLIVASFTLAWTISPIAWQRIQAARAENEARRGLLFSAGAFVLLYGLVVLIGILARLLQPSSSLGSPVLTEMITGIVPPAFGIFLFVAVAAAILSTMDTALNTAALTLSQDIYEQMVSKPQARRANPVLVGRLATFFVAGLSFAVATQFQSILKTIGLASEIMAEGLFVPGMAMFILKKRLPLAGGLSLSLGGGFALTGFLSELNFLPVRLPAWPFSVPYGVGLSLAGFGLGFLLERIRARRPHRP